MKSLGFNSPRQMRNTAVNKGNLEVTIKIQFYLIITYTYNDGRCGIVVGILDYYARGRGFDSRTVQTFMCMNMPVCIESGFLCIICMYLGTKKCI
jgi:hypothetical protein